VKKRHLSPLVGIQMPVVFAVTLLQSYVVLAITKCRMAIEEVGLEKCLRPSLPLYFFGPTRSLIGGTLAVSQVKARQPSCQPSSIVASMDWWL
jgi:hypothetical protein